MWQFNVYIIMLWYAEFITHVLCTWNKTFCIAYYVTCNAETIYTIYKHAGPQESDLSTVGF